MELEIIRKNGVVIFEPKGVFDAGSSPEITKQFKSCLEENNTKLFLIGMDKIDAINSAGLNALLEFGYSLHKDGGFLMFYSLPPNIRHMFEITGLDNLFPINISRDKALKMIKQSSDFID